MNSPTEREIEVKLRVDNLEEILRRIRDLHAQCVGRVFEQNALFDTAAHGFRTSGRLLRVRTETPAPAIGSPGGRPRTVLTYKAPVASVSLKKGAGDRPGQLKERLEREVVTGGKRDWMVTLLALGFLPGFRYEKYRTSFRLPGLHLDLDETPVGIFLEIEGHPAAIHRIATSLGYSLRDYISGTYWDLYSADCRRRGIAPHNMLFNA